MKYLILLLLVLMLCGSVFAEWSSSEKSTEAEIRWIGHPVVSDNDNYTPSQGWLPDYQIGFRDDGVVVWKKGSSSEEKIQ